MGKLLKNGMLMHAVFYLCFLIQSSYFTFLIQFYDILDKVSFNDGDGYELFFYYPFHIILHGIFHFLLLIQL